MSLPPVEPLASLRPELLAAFRGSLAEHGFVRDVLHRAESVSASPLRYVNAPGARWWLARQASAAADLARLFAWDEALPAARVEALLGAPVVGALADAGLLARLDGEVRSPFLVYPMEAGPWIVSDRLWDGADAAMGPGAGTAFLARTIPARFEGSLLDVGCGAGSLAIVAAMRGASRAVGVDINRRAVALARFNAALNGVAAEFRAGDLTRPVAGERFDRVVAQPAFVARPADGAGITYLHGGARGDELSMRLLGECPAVLAEGGRATVFFQAPAQEGGSVVGRLRAALGGAADDVDVLVLRMDGAPPTLQATVFASYEAAAADATYDAAVRRYLDHFDAVGTTAIEGLCAVLSAPDAARAEEKRYAVALPYGGEALGPNDFDALLSRLALSASSDGALLSATLRPSPQLVVTTSRALAERSPATPVLRFEAHPFGVGGPATPDAVERLRVFGAGAVVERALVTYARGERASPTTLRAAWLAFVRDALVRSRLEIVGAG